MKKNWYKIIAVIAGIAAMVFIYTSAITQTSNIKKKFQETPVTIDEDTTGEDIGALTGDDPWNEMDKLVAAYYIKNGVSYKGIVKLIDDNGNKEKIIEEQAFQYAVLKDEYAYSFGSMDVISKKEYVMAVDNSNKTIALTATQVNNKKEKFFDLSGFKKIMEDQKANAKVTQLGNEKILTIENIQDPQIQGYRIYYSPVTYKISKMLIGMSRLSPLEDENGGIMIDDNSANDETKISEEKETADTVQQETGIEAYYYFLEIIYTESRQLSISEKEFNPEKKYIHFSGGKPELEEAYKEYELLNGYKP